MEPKKISELLISLGLSPAYKGYAYLFYSIYLTCSKRQHTGLVAGELYRETATHYKVSKSTVQHSIRSLLDVYWSQENADHFTQITGFPVHSTLPPKEFIAVVSEFLMQMYDIPYIQP